MYRSLILTSTVLLCLSSYSFAAEPNCREAVIDAYASMGEKLAETGFSNAKYEDLNITTREFNNLTSEEQDIIYKRVKPLSVMVDETINKLNRYINRYVGSTSEFFMLDEIDSWRQSRDNLRSCEN